MSISLSGEWDVMVLRTGKVNSAYSLGSSTETWNGLKKGSDKQKNKRNWDPYYWKCITRETANKRHRNSKWSQSCTGLILVENVGKGNRSGCWAQWHGSLSVSHQSHVPCYVTMIDQFGLALFIILIYCSEPHYTMPKAPPDCDNSSKLFVLFN